jgi:dCMP deaminase
MKKKRPGFRSEEKIDWYMGFAEQAAKRSPDAETKVGSALVNLTTGAVLSMGFNGFARGAPDRKLPNTRPLKYDLIIHSEINLLANCGRHGIPMDNCELYCTLSPCISCMRTMWQCGISRIYVKELYRDMDKIKEMKDLNIEIHHVGKFYVLEYSVHV